MSTSYWLLFFQYCNTYLCTRQPRQLPKAGVLNIFFKKNIYFDLEEFTEIILSFIPQMATVANPELTQIRNQEPLLGPPYGCSVSSSCAIPHLFPRH